MKKATPPKPDPRIRMYFRVKPETRQRFKAVAQLAGETTEGRLERLMLDDIVHHLPVTASSA
jgi:hypothetical protein